MLRRLIVTYNQVQYYDIVAGRSKGLVVLLHGEPGYKKTLTAESISESVGKPPFRLTSGELDTDVQSAERKLDEIFILAQHWRAILLLNKADVFLAARGTGKILHNAFVSIFLKRLEWYDGILILTTNHKTGFNDAFKSRIQLTIPYKAPDATQRAVLWKQFIRDQSATFDLDEEAFARLGRDFKLSGREIKNMVFMATCEADIDKKVTIEEVIRDIFKVGGNSSKVEG